jgi:hypothetical protein
MELVSRAGAGTRIVVAIPASKASGS